MNCPRCGQPWYVDVYANLDTVLSKYYCYLCGYPDLTEGIIIELK